MRSGRAIRTYLPTPHQRQLLQVALGPGEDAGRIWRNLRPDFVLDVLEPGSFELMPLVYRALSAGDVPEPLLPRLKGIYRRSWARNNLQLEKMRRTAMVLEGAAIPALLVGGVGVASRFYPDLGLRPTSVNHLLVAREALSAAAWRALRVGWTPRADVPNGPDGRRWLLDDEGSALVLQPTVEPDFVSPSGEDLPGELLLRSERLPIGEGSAAIAGPADALVLAIVSGMRTGVEPSIQWIPDAVMIVRSGAVDWARVVDLVRRSGQLDRFRDGLEVLESLGLIEAPPELTRALHDARSSRRERVVYRCTTAPAGRLGALPNALGQHLAETAGTSTARSIGSFPSHLRRRWRLERTWHVPVAACRRAIRILAQGPPS